MSKPTKKMIEALNRLAFRSNSSPRSIHKATMKGLRSRGLWDGGVTGEGARYLRPQAVRRARVKSALGGIALLDFWSGVTNEGISEAIDPYNDIHYLFIDMTKVIVSRPSAKLVEEWARFSRHHGEVAKDISKYGKATNWSAKCWVDSALQLSMILGGE